jgi:DNA-binding response OmpR family regulator
MADPGVIRPILIIDDEPQVRHFCRQAPGRPASDEAAAIRVRPYELVLLDVDMPGTDGTAAHAA